MKRLAIVQSNYIPWKGYFDLINSVDEFILFDDAQYTRHDWRNRNKIKTTHGVIWLSIPIEVKGRFHQKIREARVSDGNWQATHWKSIAQAYSKARYFAQYRERVEDLYRSSASQYLSESNYTFLSALCSLLGIHTPMTWSSDYDLPPGKTERLVALCQQAGATEYVSGPAAKSYLDETLFTKEGIRVRWMDYSDYPEYHQLFPPFEHSVSVIDLLFNEGPNAWQYMKSFQAVLPTQPPSVRTRMSENRQVLLRSVEAYYTAKVVEHGPTARGADWNSETSQYLRFQQLLRVVEGQQGPFSLNDIGCGYGALAAYLHARWSTFHYHGFDLSSEMVRLARTHYGYLANCRFSHPPTTLTPAHYTVASGIFNVKLATETEHWRAYMLDTIDQLAALSTRGFAFNVLTSYADPDRMRPDLYYADPCFLFDYCQRRYSRWVAVLHDYGLYEFTVVVRKEGVR